MKRRKKTILLLYSILLAAFSVYFLLDTFVIERVYSAEVPAAQSAQTESAAAQNEDSGSADIGQGSGSTDTEPGSGSASEAAATQSGSTEVTGQDGVFTAIAAPVITEDSYYDGNISIKITEYRQNDTTIYAADIQLSSAEYLKTALAKGVFGRNVTAKTSSTAADNDAILAVNGDYYGSQERGYVIRGGVIYRSTAVSGRQDLVIYGDGSMEVIYETDISAEELLAKGARDVLSFGPELLKDGKIAVNSSYEVARATN
ncbi:MAG: phosphodiester glycosidase family protein, partial [Firmicutes bacterium]|nr:phosphodiester glycosidase family protein [Bacillota bacterium]